MMLGMLTTDPIIAPGLWVTLAMACAVVLAVYGWRRPAGILRGRWRGILTLMGIAMGLVLVLLLNPTWRTPVAPPAGKPLLTILVDASASMGTRDVGGGAGQSRFEAAAHVAKEVEAAAGGGFDVRVRRFDAKTVPVSDAELLKTPPTGEVTDIAGAIRESLEADRPQGQAVVVLTDGIQSEDAGESAAVKLRGAAQYARAAGAPVYGVVLGGGGGGVDVSVQAHGANEFAFVGQKATIAADIRARGYTGTVRVRLLSEGKEIDRKTVNPGTDGTASTTFEVSQEKPGLYRYEFQADSAAGTQELTLANNSALCLLRVVNQPVKVMLVEGKPYWDSKFLTRQLAADASIDLHSLVQVTAGRVLERTVSRNTAAGAEGKATDQWHVLKDPGKLLADPAILRGCQILVLGRDTEDLLSGEALANVQRWISREGGAVVCYRGSPETQMDPALARLLPVKWEPSPEAHYQMKLTETGRNLDWFGDAADERFLSLMPALASDTRVELTKPLTVVVAEAQWPGKNQSPAVSYQPYGAGRVVVIEGAGMWRWAFPPAKAEAAAVKDAKSTDQVYAGVWHALFRWIISGSGLVPGENAAIRPDKVAFAEREPVAATVLYRSQAPQQGLAVSLGGPVSRAFACVASPEDPEAYRVEFGVLPPGRYTVMLGGAKADGPTAQAVFDVRQFGEEQLNLTARPDVLAMLAGDSGGAVVAREKAGEIATLMKQHLAAERPERVMFASAWDRLGVFVLVLALWGCAWALRRSSGLI